MPPRACAPVGCPRMRPTRCQVCTCSDPSGIARKAITRNSTAQAPPPWRVTAQAGKVRTRKNTSTL